jgi:hypothetical protein
VLEVLFALDEVRRYADRTFAPNGRPERYRIRSVDPETRQRIGARASAQEADRTLWRRVTALYHRSLAVTRLPRRSSACLDR